MPYPENFVVRLIICVVGMLALWLAAHYIGVVLVRHETFTIGAFDIVVPAICGVIESFTWKPKNK